MEATAKAPVSRLHIIVSPTHHNLPTHTHTHTHTQTHTHTHIHTEKSTELCFRI